jgi:ferritin-like metal-binding protein YciE
MTDAESVRRVLARFIQFELEKHRSEMTEHLHKLAYVYGVSPEEVKRTAKPVVQGFIDEMFNVRSDVH